jgi:hypothetical protein
MLFIEIKATFCKKFDEVPFTLHGHLLCYVNTGVTTVEAFMFHTRIGRDTKSVA